MPPSRGRPASFRVFDGRVLLVGESMLYLPDSLWRGQLQPRCLLPRVCYFTGKRTTAGRQYTRRGKAKYLGGVGTKVTGISKRKFKPNIQTVRAVIGGRIMRLKVSAKAIRMGLVVKPMKRNWKPETPAAEQPHAPSA